MHVMGLCIGSQRIKPGRLGLHPLECDGHHRFHARHRGVFGNPFQTALAIGLKLCGGFGFSPHNQNIKGVSKLSSRVELIKPPKMTTASGCSTSLPGQATDLRPLQHQLALRNLALPRPQLADDASSTIALIERT
jgi:hypothetical protein